MEPTPDPLREHLLALRDPQTSQQRRNDAVETILNALARPLARWSQRYRRDLDDLGQDAAIWIVSEVAPTYCPPYSAFAYTKLVISRRLQTAALPIQRRT